MPITLLTGTPGTGKTAWIVKELLEFRKANPTYYIFVHGIRNLRGLAFEPVYCKSQLCDICRSSTIAQDAKYVENWHEWKEPESLIVVDEVQRIWRPRVGSSQITPAVAMLETHRHYGVDFWIISQGSHLFDNFIRLLVGRHIHLVANWAGRKQYEWSECKQDVSSKTDAIVRPYTLPKHVFKHYDSAEVHTKQDKRKPLSFYGVIILFCIAAFLIYRVANRLSQTTHPDAVTTTATNDKTVTPETTATTTEQQPTDKKLEPAKPTFPDFKPTIVGVPESAPAYAPLLKVTAVPTITACVYSKKKDKCTCYTSQATIYPTSKEFCMEDVQGKRFNPYFVHVPPSVESNPHREDKPEQLSDIPHDNNNCIIKPVMTEEERRACQS